MIEASELKKLEKENLKFIGVRQTSPTNINMHFSYTTKRGKRVELFYYFNKRSNDYYLTFNCSHNRTQELRIQGSILAHEIKNHIEQLPSFRVRTITNSFPINFGAGIEEDVEKYIQSRKKRRTASMKKAEVLALKEEILSFYEEMKTKPAHRNNETVGYWEYSVLLVSRREGRYLVDMLQEMGIASWTKWSNSYNVSFNFTDFVGDSFMLRELFADKLQKMGFQAWTHTWYD